MYTRLRRRSEPSGWSYANTGYPISYAGTASRWRTGGILEAAPRPVVTTGNCVSLFLSHELLPCSEFRRLTTAQLLLHRSSHRCRPGGPSWPHKRRNCRRQGYIRKDQTWPEYPPFCMKFWGPNPPLSRPGGKGEGGCTLAPHLHPGCRHPVGWDYGACSGCCRTNRRSGMKHEFSESAGGVEQRRWPVSATGPVQAGDRGLLVRRPESTSTAATAYCTRA